MNTLITSRKEMTGNKHGRLFVLGFSHRGNQNRAFWNCQCDCNKKIVVSGSKLRSGHTQSCGCKRSEGLMGENHPNWQGGITPINRRIRHTKKYKIWRTSVFIRDNYTCVLCGSKGYLNADHIKAFSTFPNLRFEISNGRTLCLECHKETDTYGGRTKRPQKIV